MGDCLTGFVVLNDEFKKYLYMRGLSKKQNF